MRSPHILLASSNPQKLITNIEHLVSKRAADALRREVRANVSGLFRLGEQHYTFAATLPTSDWRQIVSRCYYGAYNVVRSVKLEASGHYSTDSTDHKKIDELPSTFPNRNTYSNRLSMLREDRNLCDYDHTVTEVDLVYTIPEALRLVQGFIQDSRTYLRVKGLRV